MRTLFLTLIVILVSWGVNAQNVESKKRVLVYSTNDQTQDERYGQGIATLINSTFSTAVSSTPTFIAIDHVFRSSRTDELGYQEFNVTSEQIKSLQDEYGAEYILFSSVAYVDPTTIVITASLIDVESAVYIVPSINGISGNTAKEIEAKCIELADKIFKNSSIASVEVTSRSGVEIILGYLKVYPEELGEFPYLPTAMINEINRQAMYDYDSWRVPTDEELALLKVHKMANNTTYITTTNSEVSGNVILVTTEEETFSSKQARIAEEQRIAEEKRKAEELRKAEEERIRREREAEEERRRYEEMEREREWKREQAEKRRREQRTKDALNFIGAIGVSLLSQ